MRLGITGHQSLRTRIPDPRLETSAWRWATVQFAKILDECSPENVTVISSLATGTDQLFSKIALDKTAALEVIIPSHRYIQTFAIPADRELYHRLLGKATSVETLDYPAPSERAYMAAGRRIIQTSDQLIALWDGATSRGLGGTGDVVSFAIKRKCPVIHLNPVTKQVLHLGGAKRWPTETRHS